MKSLSSNAKRSRRAPYIVVWALLMTSAGRMCRAILSMASPMAMSVVEAQMSCAVSVRLWTRSVCPPETRRERKGYDGCTVLSFSLLAVVSSGDSCIPGLVASLSPSSFSLRSRASTSRGVRACACMWLTPTSGTCHAVASPLAVSMPVERFERIPGPRVTVTKSGFLAKCARRLFHMTSLFHCCILEPFFCFFDPSLLEFLPLAVSLTLASGRWSIALSTNLARFC